MRIFIAIEISEEVSSYLTKIQQKIKQDGLTIAKEPHLTLKFLGWIDEKTIDEVKESLAKIRFSAFELKLTALGGFPNLNFPRVIFAGLHNSSELTNLQKQVDEATHQVKEDKPFSAHITLARVKTKVQISQMSLDPLSFSVKEFKLMQSTLTPSGPQYLELANFPAKNL